MMLKTNEVVEKSEKNNFKHFKYSKFEATKFYLLITGRAGCNLCRFL